MEWEKLGRVGVDSGQVLIVDPCYIDKNFKGEKFDPDDKKIELTYNGCYNASDNKKRGGEIPIGKSYAVAMQSGYGDGGYNVFVKRNKEGRISEVKIVFITENEKRIWKKLTKRSITHP